MKQAESKTIEFIRERLQNVLQPSYLEVLDESEQHKGHAGYFQGGSHFAVKISAACLHGLSRVEVHRKIYGALGDAMDKRIHALRIEVV